MTDIVVTAASVRRVEASNDVVVNLTAGATLTAGMAVILNATTGKAVGADGGATGTAQVIGIALDAASSGQGVSVLMQGKVAGFTLAGDYYTRVYLSDTGTNTGTLADSAGTVSVVVGRVWPVTDGSGTKLLYVSTVINNQNT
jgi:hypothetical protein